MQSFSSKLVWNMSTDKEFWMKDNDIWKDVVLEANEQGTLHR